MYIMFSKSRRETNLQYNFSQIRDTLSKLILKFRQCIDISYDQLIFFLKFSEGFHLKMIRFITTITFIAKHKFVVPGCLPNF